MNVTRCEELYKQRDDANFTELKNKVSALLRIFYANFVSRFLALVRLCDGVDDVSANYYKDALFAFIMFFRFFNYLRFQVRPVKLWKE
jgi:hypothetical protein